MARSGPGFLAANDADRVKAPGIGNIVYSQPIC
jgi:hypothetical protein